MIDGLAQGHEGLYRLRRSSGLNGQQQGGVYIVLVELVTHFEGQPA